MNDDMPWVNLTQEEVQELRSKKQELTQYGKDKIRELMNHEEMLEVAAQREAENKALEALDKLYKENDEGMKKLAEMTREERVEAGIQEIWWIVQGGQDGREYANSISFVIQVLDSLR